MTEKLWAINNEPSHTFEYQQYPRCPHCGITYDIERHEKWELYGSEDGEETVLECGGCSHEFTVTANVSHSFSTDEQPEDDE